MKTWIAGGLLSASALVGTAVVAVPSAADWLSGDGVQGEADSSPVEPQPGEQVTVSYPSCRVGTTDIWWSLHPYGWAGALAQGQAPLAGDGSWEVTFPAPDDPGEYHFFAVCLPPGAAPPDIPTILAIQSTEGAPDELLDEWGVDSVFYFSHLVIVSGPGGPTPPGPGPAPIDPADGPAPVDADEEGPGATTTVPVAPAAVAVPGTPTYTG